MPPISMQDRRWCSTYLAWMRSVHSGPAWANSRSQPTCHFCEKVQEWSLELRVTGLPSPHIERNRRGAVPSRGSKPESCRASESPSRFWMSSKVRSIGLRRKPRRKSSSCSSISSLACLKLRSATRAGFARSCSISAVMPSSSPRRGGFSFASKPSIAPMPRSGSASKSKILASVSAPSSKPGCSNQLTRPTHRHRAA
jgi:hypothetical protein